ncbi:YkvA family protein [Cyanothece sp. BG0011]|uniref:YkvA family protein n=1 Tax=Cyanothece sp. BG0011 TaxID=2082950 RepID=UPI000D1F0708|nr:YkvA family protein [Cyanothece sp. BG0011]
MDSIVKSFYNWYRSKIQHPQYRWFIILGTVAYLLLPFDIAPDFIPILGWIDDGLILSLLVGELSALFLEHRQKGNKSSITQEDKLNKEQTIDVEPVS